MVKNQKLFIITVSVILFNFTLLRADFLRSAEDFIKVATDDIVKVAKSATQKSGINLTATELQKEAREALDRLYRVSPKALQLSKKAKAILIFPNVIEANFAFGGMYGEGVLFQDGNVSGYYNIVAASYGLKAGVQKYSYAIFFMDKESLNYLLKHNDGWEIGTGPAIVLADKGATLKSTNTTMNQSVYLFIFGQEGLMVGVDIQGSKITKIDPPK